MVDALGDLPFQIPELCDGDRDMAERPSIMPDEQQFVRFPLDGSYIVKPDGPGGPDAAKLDVILEDPHKGTMPEQKKRNPGREHHEPEQKKQHNRGGIG